MKQPSPKALELERRRRHAVNLLHQVESPTVVARFLGVNRVTLYRWLRQEQQPGGLAAKPHFSPAPRLTDPQLANTTVLSGDLAAAIGELKAKPGGELQVHGSGALTRWLLDNDLVDEMNLVIFPVVVGQGTRLFPDTGRDMALDLVESQAFPKGITIQVYRSAGRLQYATATAARSHRA